MGTLKQLIRNWLSSDLEKYAKPQAIQAIQPINNYTGPGSRCINFVLRPATGGWVIETSRYDHHTDRHESSLYVITDFDALGAELAKIVSLESLKC